MSTPNAITIDQVIAKYMQIREEKSALVAQTKALTDALDKKMETIEKFIKVRATEDGVTSFKTSHGTAFLTTVDFANVADWDTVLNFIKDNDAYDMLQRRVSKEAVRGYIDANKEVPPGITYGTKLEVNVRRPANKGE
jgi:hypothetical protein